MEKKRITLTAQQLQGFVQCLDTHQKAHGIQASKMVLELLEVLQSGEIVEDSDGD